MFLSLFLSLSRSLVTVTFHISLFRQSLPKTALAFVGLNASAVTTSNRTLQAMLLACAPAWIAIILATATCDNYIFKERCLEPAVAVWHGSNRDSRRSHSHFDRFKPLPRLDEFTVAFASGLYTDAVLSGCSFCQGKRVDQYKASTRWHVLKKKNSSVMQFIKTLTSLLF